jgi:gamma-glutamyltranspeptidase/glutathione hydrolase
MCAATAACVGEGPVIGVIEGAPPANGGVAADEPFAAQAARDVLSAGGSAADAALAGYFVLSVTYPVAASLAAGGMCMAFDSQTGDVKSIDFLPRPAQGGPAGADAFVVPGAIRGVTALQARYGKLRLEQLVQPAERLARFGHRVSRALAVQVAEHQDRMRQDPGTQRIFFRRDGSPVGEGDLLFQPELASMLATIRTRGVAEFYGGALTSRYVDGVAQLGGTLDREDFRGYRPNWTDTGMRRLGNDEIHFLQPAAREDAIRAWDTLMAQNTYVALDSLGASRDKTPTSPVLAQLYTRTSTATRPIEFPKADGGTGIAIIDRDGNMVACGFTLFRAFGAAREIPGTGILLSEAAGAGAGSPFALMMSVNRVTKLAYMAATASQGSASAGAMALVAARTLAARQASESAISEPRAVPAVGFGLVLVEERGEALASRLTSQGISVERVADLGLVNLVRCPIGTRRGTTACEYRSDPRGLGLGLGAE